MATERGRDGANTPTAREEGEMRKNNCVRAMGTAMGVLLLGAALTACATMRQLIGGGGASTTRPTQTTRSSSRCPTTVTYPHIRLRAQSTGRVEGAEAVAVRFIVDSSERGCPPALAADTREVVVSRGGTPIGKKAVRDGVVVLTLDEAYPAMVRSAGMFHFRISAIESGGKVVALDPRRSDRFDTARVELQELEELARLRTEQLELQRERQRLEQEARRRQLVGERVQELGLQDWTGHCTRISLMLDHACDGLDSVVEQGECGEARKAAFKRKVAFVIPNVHHTVEYDARRRVFRVTVLGVLAGDYDLGECFDITCEAALVSTQALRVSRGSAKYPVWEKRLQDAMRGLVRTAATTFTIPVDAVSSPDTLEDDLRVMALVQAIDAQTVAVGEWFHFRNVRVRVVGLQAYLPDLSWGAVVKRPPARVGEGACPTELFVGEDETMAP